MAWGGAVTASSRHLYQVIQAEVTRSFFQWLDSHEAIYWPLPRTSRKSFPKSIYVNLCGKKISISLLGSTHFFPKTVTLQIFYNTDTALFAFRRAKRERDLLSNVPEGVSGVTCLGSGVSTWNLSLVVHVTCPWQLYVCLQSLTGCLFMVYMYKYATGRWHTLLEFLWNNSLCLLLAFQHTKPLASEDTHKQPASVATLLATPMSPCPHQGVLRKTSLPITVIPTCDCEPWCCFHAGSLLPMPPKSGLYTLAPPLNPKCNCRDIYISSSQHEVQHARFSFEKKNPQKLFVCKTAVWSIFNFHPSGSLLIN